MAKVQFKTEVKYNGVLYAANTSIDVTDADLESLEKDGASIIETSVEIPKVPDKEPDLEPGIDPEKEPEKEIEKKTSRAQNTK